MDFVCVAVLLVFGLLTAGMALACARLGGPRP